MDKMDQNLDSSMSRQLEIARSYLKHTFRQVEKSSDQFDCDSDHEVASKEVNDAKPSGDCAQTTCSKPFVPYDKEVLIILDYDPNQSDPVIMGRPKESSHQSACRAVKAFFEKYTLFEEAVCVKFGRRANEKDWFDLMKDLLEGYDENTLVVIHYHGNAGNEPENYSIKFEKYPAGEVDLYKFFTMIKGSQARHKAISENLKDPELIEKWNKEQVKKDERPELAEESVDQTNYGMNATVEADIFLFWDAFIPTRIIPYLKRDVGNLEILAQPTALQDTRGNMKRCDGDFTLTIIKMLEDFVENFDKKYGGYSALHSIPELLRTLGGKDVYSNPIHLFSDKPVKGTKSREGNESKRDVPKLIRRPKIDPADIRKHGKMQFVGECVQGAPPKSSRKVSRMEGQPTKEEAWEDAKSTIYQGLFVK